MSQEVIEGRKSRKAQNDVPRELIERLPMLKVNVVGREGSWLLIKLPKQRKVRRCVVMEAEDGFIVQGDDVIFRVYKEPMPWAWVNPKGQYFFHLRPEMGARPVRVPEEFLEACEEVAYRKGDVIGVFPSDRGPTKVIFGGAGEF